MIQPLYSLHELLRTNDGQDAFGRFLKSEYSGENLSFWLATRRYKNGPGKLKKLIYQICLSCETYRKQIILNNALSKTLIFFVNFKKFA